MELRVSTRKDKKYMAIFKDGTVTHFGAKGYDDFTTTNDEFAKQLYLKRHKKNENWNDFKSAGALARWILWNKPTIKASLHDYKRRFIDTKL